MTDTRLDEIRARADATIEGPWCWFGNREVDSIFLATNHSGTQYILSPRVRTQQYVYDHDLVESFPLEEARKRYLLDPGILPPADHDYFKLSLEEMAALAKARGLEVTNSENSDESPIEDDYADALAEYDGDHGLSDWHAQADAQEALRDFLADDISEEEATRHLRFKGESRLVRGIMHHAELYFQDFNTHRMVSYRDIARFEVLGGRTEAEHAASGDTTRSLYREDIVGLDNPEATFIAHAREDVDYLLEKIEQLGRALEAASS